MAEASTYTGGCHCGAVRFRVTLAIERVIACNCSMCGRRGSLLAFAPATAFELTSGADALTDYQFHKHVIHNLFCRTCGITSFARGRSPAGEMVAINVRCLDGVDPLAFPVDHVDGRSF